MMHHQKRKVKNETEAETKIIQSVLQHRDKLKSLKDILLANLVMVGEIPAETYKEERRVRFILDRFRECGLDKISTDEANNALAVLPGSEGKRSILVCAHVDTLFEESIDHTVKVDAESVFGAGVADNSLGAAVLCSLATILQRLNVILKSDLVLMGASRSLGRGSLEGIGFFLENHHGDIRAGVCVEGVDLGRLSYQSIGMLRGEIICRIPESASKGAQVNVGTIQPLAEIVRRIEEIPVPHRPLTTITLGALNAGNSFHQAASKGMLKLELRSAKAGMVPTLQGRLEEIVKRVALETGVEIELEIISKCRNGGIDFEHPLTLTTRKVMDQLSIKPIVKPSVGELSVLISKGIPGVTLGITERASSCDSHEGILIEPMFSGIAQLVAMLQAIDQGMCDGEDESMA